jgi:very-short-patch-repair endonuclease
MLEERLAALGGFARTRDLVRTSGDRRRLARSVAVGSVIRVARGVVALPGAESPALALARGGALTCVSALGHYGLPLLASPTNLHVAVPPHRGAEQGVVQHWTTARVVPGVVPLPLALAHAQRCLPVAEWVAAIDAAVRRGMELVDLAAHRPLRGRVAFDAALRAVDARSESLPESLLRVALRDAGLEVRPQAVLPGVGRVDLLVDGLVVEVDGFAYHSGREQYREDRRRDRAVHRLGLVVLRYTFEDVVRHLPQVIEEIAALAASAGVGRQRPRGPEA